MKVNELKLLVITLIVGMMVIPALSAKDFKKNQKDGPMSAVVDFENKSEYGGWRLGRAAADVLTTELVKGTSLRCMEREKLDSILKEKNLSASGLTTPDTYVKMGGMLGVKYIITGAISSFGEKEVGGSGFGAAINFVFYKVVIDVRIVDAATGEIVFSESADGEKKSPRIFVMGAGGGESYDESAAQKILREACKSMAEKIEAALV